MTPMEDARYVDVSSVDLLAEGSMVRVVPAGFEPLAVCKIDGEIYVVSDTCTHATASLSEGELDGHTIACPAHWGEFDVRTGQPLCFPATEPLNVYRARIVDGKILVSVDVRTESEGSK